MSIRWLSVALSVGVLWLGLLLAPQEGRAQTDAFVVRSVQVDVTAETAAAAREAAHAQGHVQALQRLMARLLPRDQLPLAPRLKAQDILSYVQDFSVADERTSDVRYLASLTFRFNPGPVRQLILSNGLLHAETVSKPVIVLPVFGAQGEAALWGDTNVWWSAWAARPPADGLVPLIVPLGDLGDITTIDAERALAGDQAALSAIARRYGAEDVLVTQAVLIGDPESGQATLQVGTSRLGRHAQQTMIDNHSQTPQETLQDLLARAAEVVEDRVQEAWKQSNLLRPGSQRSISAVVPVTRLVDWLEVKRRLAGVAAVRAVEVVTLSRSKTEVAITFVGDEEQLALAMAQSDLNLALYPGIGWELQMAGADTGSRASPTAVTAPGGDSGTDGQPPAATETGVLPQPATGTDTIAPAPTDPATTGPAPGASAPQ